jgi:hypothetical protein
VPEGGSIRVMVLRGGVPHEVRSNLAIAIAKERRHDDHARFLNTTSPPTRRGS